VLEAINPAICLGVPPHRAFGDGRDPLGEHPDVASERLGHDIEVPPCSFLGLDDPSLESVPRLDEAGVDVTPHLADLGLDRLDLLAETALYPGDLSLDLPAEIALQPFEGVTRLGVHRVTLAVRPPSVNVAHWIPLEKRADEEVHSGRRQAALHGGPHVDAGHRHAVEAHAEGRQRILDGPVNPRPGRPAPAPPPAAPAAARRC